MKRNQFIVLNLFPICSLQASTLFAEDEARADLRDEVKALVARLNALESVLLLQADINEPPVVLVGDFGK